MALTYFEMFWLQEEGVVTVSVKSFHILHLPLKVVVAKFEASWLMMWNITQPHLLTFV